MATATPELQKTLIFSQGETKTKHEFQLSAEELQKRAESGDPAAQNMLGTYLRLGLSGLKINKEEGNKWKILAAKDTSSPAGLMAQGLCYEIGIGDQIVKNHEMAKACYTKAAEQGCIPALYSWAMLLSQEEDTAENKLFETYNRNPYNQVYRAALASLQTSHQEIRQKIVSMAATCAQAGYAPAQNFLGWCYEAGWGGSQKDPQEANKLYEFAANQGMTTARRNLGLNYREGVGFLKNKEQATKWLALAAEQGDEVAQKALSSSSCCTIM